MQPVRALATEDLHREIPGEIVRVLAWNRQLANADLRLHRIRLVHDDQPACRLWWIDGLPRRNLAARPLAEHTPGLPERILTSDVADDRQDHVVGHEVLTMELPQIVLRDVHQRLWRSAPR